MPQIPTTIFMTSQTNRTNKKYILLKQDIRNYQVVLYIELIQAIKYYS